MKSLYKLGFCLLCLFCSLQVYSQTDYTKEAKKDLTIKGAQFKTAKDIYEKEKKRLDTLSNNLDTLSITQLIKVRKLKITADSLITQAEIVRNFYIQKKVHKDSLDAYFTIPENFKGTPPNLTAETANSEKAKTYIVFGEDKVLLQEDVIKDDKVAKIFQDILKENPQVQIGSFRIPKDGAEIPVFFKCDSRTRRYMEKSDCYEKEENSKRTLKFKSIQIEIYEGSLVDIKVLLEGNNDKVYLFENELPASLLRYTKQSKWFELKNRAEETFEETDNDFFGYRIKLADVLRYISKPGKNFIPDNQSLDFPKMINGKKTNSDAPSIYELKQSTSLNNFVNLRTYTDFLGLFGESPNGIAHIEGDAEFFIAPFRVPYTSLYFFKKIKPYVSYARLDENDRQLIPQRFENNGTAEQDIFEIRNDLDILQKSYLDLGFQLDVINFKIEKEYPFETNFYGVARYQVADINFDQNEENTTDDITDGSEDLEVNEGTVQNIDQLNNYKALGLGAGVNFDFKRFDNFTFSYSAELIKYNVNSINDFEDFRSSNDFWVFRNEAEISYFAGNKKKNAIFVRLKVFDNIDSGDNSNFFQFQFGYKFSLGLQKIQAKN